MILLLVQGNKNRHSAKLLGLFLCHGFLLPGWQRCYKSLTNPADYVAMKNKIINLFHIPNNIFPGCSLLCVVGANKNLNTNREFSKTQNNFLPKNKISWNCRTWSCNQWGWQQSFGLVAAWGFYFLTHEKAQERLKLGSQRSGCLSCSI